MAKILVVEDDVILCDAYREKFGERYEVRVATTGEEGLLLAKVVDPDVIILDIYLSNKVNGVEVLKKIKENEKTRNVPILVITNLPNMDKTVLDLGADRCVMKADVDLNMIEDMIESLLQKSTK